MPSFCLGELAARLQVELRGDPQVVITGVATPEAARPGEIALLTDPQRLGEGSASQASAFVVTRPLEAIAGRPQLICNDPARALGLLLDLFCSGPGHPDDDPGVDPRAAVDPTARVEPTAWIGPFVYVGPGAEVGARARVEPFSYVGAGARVGQGCRLGPGAVLAAGALLDDAVVLGPGAVVGYRGFGFWRDEQGWHPIASPGGVVVGRQAEIGANACVDAGTLAPTHIGEGVKIDNLVQVGHNASVGDRSLLCAQVGLAGSVRVEQDCQLGGQVGVADHRRLGRGCRVGAKSGIAQDVPPGAAVSGYPAIDHRRWLRSSALFARLGELYRQLQRVVEQVAALAERPPR
jgi:UDP-3-O-[3-hydroxymyristoyl] glucosamine N-acyltransferase